MKILTAIYGEVSGRLLFLFLGLFIGVCGLIAPRWTYCALAAKAHMWRKV